MARITEGTIRINDRDLYTRTWSPADEPPVAVLVFLVGNADHCGLYDDFFTALARRAIEVRSYDPRGFGRSAPEPHMHGDAGSPSETLSEPGAFIRRQLASPRPDVPLFVMGYSNGALSAATLMSLPEYADLATQVRGWLLASLHVAVPADKVFALSATRYVSMLLPKRKVYNSFDLANVTSDPEVIQRMEADPLFNRVGTMEFFAGIEARARALRTGRVRLNRDIRSVWVGHGTADKVHPYTDTKAWYDKQTHLEDGTFQTYDGWDHQLHASAPGTSEIFYKDIGDWILARAK